MDKTIRLILKTLFGEFAMGNAPNCDQVQGATGLFGYQRSNPIPGDADIYCRRLRCPNGHGYWYHRLGSAGASPDGHILDIIELMCFHGESRITLYFDMYHQGISSMVPEGLTLGEAIGIGNVHARYFNFPEDLPGYDRSKDNRSK